MKRAIDHVGTCQYVWRRHRSSSKVRVVTQTNHKLILEYSRTYIVSHLPLDHRFHRPQYRHHDIARHALTVITPSPHRPSCHRHTHAIAIRSSFPPLSPPPQGISHRRP